MTNTRTPIRTLFAGLISVVAYLNASPIATAQEMVSPETLPQGFIVIVEDQSKTASASRPIYFASGANSWDPGDNDFQLSPRSDGRWQFVFEGGTLGRDVEFKFTLGGWSSVETDPEGQDIPNRQFPDVAVGSFAQGERPVIELTIPKFRDGADGHVIAPDYRPLEVTGTARRLQVASGAGSAGGMMRDLLVWLPPSYGDTTETYPVLYMHDGQNLFQNHEGVPTEWGMDETATRLISNGEIAPFIVVGIPHGGDSRMEEYAPSMGEGVELFGTTPAGDDHVEWLAREVMPRVERAFRVKTGPANTGVGGASAGGLIALHAAHQRPDLFGMVLAESPALQLDMVGLDMVERYAQAEHVPARVYIGMGELEHLSGSGFYDRDSKRHVKAAKALRDTLQGRSDVQLVVGADHDHNETAWADRLPGALRFLLGGG